ncbi:zinc finger protein 112-like isoform X1 [Oncorhynchus clarkii lewisi]|uniref:zinc finger protein 112-like isoform X1 n=1 Tax=Oncorhynchus clarkii lewisi TaxID=490388 RepID=UPI0039B965AE
MSSSVPFHTQLTSIMEVLMNAAVSEICELVDDGYAVLHLEISRSQKENDVLREKLHIMETRNAHGHGKKSVGLAHERSIRNHLPVRPVLNLETGENRYNGSPMGKELNHLCSDEEHPSNENEDSIKQSCAVMKSMVKEMRKPGYIQIKEERLEGTISLQNYPMIKGESSVESGADEDKRDVIGHTQTDSLFEDYDSHINADQESESTFQKLQHTNVAHHVQRQGYSGLWTPRSTETDSEDPACSYAAEMSPTRVTAHTKQQRQTSVAEETLFAVESHNVKPEAAMLDSGPYEEKYQSSSNDNYYDNDSSNDLHPQNSISSEASENFGNIFSNSQENMRENTARSKVGIVQRYMAGHTIQHRVGKREKRFVCGFCRKSFTCPKYLQSHQRVHTGEKPFSCSQCGKRFGQAGYLKKHQNVHTGEKPFVCPLCGKRFADSSNLIRHKSVHTGERPFICIQCGERFAAKDNLRIHLERNHSGCSSAGDVMSPSIP